MMPSQAPELSICIATFRRAAFIRETLQSIADQLIDGVEVVILDGNSPDETPTLANEFCEKYSQFRYFREATNSGVDADYDKAVGYARGRYCWLMTDDDLLLPGAIRMLLDRIAKEPDVDLLILNAEVRDVDLSGLLQQRLHVVADDRRYADGEEETLFVEVARHLKFIGAVVVRREVWLERDRKSYYGSLFIHAGVIFQTPPLGRAYVIAAPLLAIRYGNAMWTARGFEIWMFLWPSLVWSFPAFSERAKAIVSAREPWRHLTKLGMHRATGGYSMAEYRKFFSRRVPPAARVLPFVMAALPARLVNAMASVYCVLLYKSARLNMYDLLRSRHASWVTRLAARVIGV